MRTLISATPSPYARKNRIALLERNIPFELQSEIPWESATQTPKYNPLEKLPILIFFDGKPPIYESWLIQEYITQKYADRGPSLLPKGGVDDLLRARQIQVLADGACDAMGLAFFETSREERKSEEWMSRQLRKVNGTIKALNELVKARGGRRFLVGEELTIADIAAGAMLGLMNMGETQFGLIKWKEDYPDLVKYSEWLEEKESFKATRPVMFDLKEKVA